MRLRSSRARFDQHQLARVLPSLVKVASLGEGAYGSVQLVVHPPARAAYALKTQEIKNAEVLVPVHNLCEQTCPVGCVCLER